MINQSGVTRRLSDEESTKLANNAEAFRLVRVWYPNRANQAHQLANNQHKGIYASKHPQLLEPWHHACMLAFILCRLGVQELNTYAADGSEPKRAYACRHQVQNLGVLSIN